MAATRRKRALAAVAPVLPALAVAPRPAVATPDQEPPTLVADGVTYDVYDMGDGWFEHRHQRSLLDVATADSAAAGRPLSYTTRTLQGEPVSTPEGTGCSYNGEVSSDPAGGTEGLVWHQRETAVNPNQCQVDVEEAWLSQGALETSGLLPTESPSGTAATDVGEGEEAALAATSYKNNGYIRGYVEDPPNLDVSSTTSQVKWTERSNGCVSWWSESRWYWLSGSGWTDVQRTNDRHLTCQHGLQTFGKYKNGIFCLTNDTFTQEDVDFHTRGHRASWASWDVQRLGGCSWLLNGQHTYDPY
jgi:hypothetical protein